MNSWQYAPLLLASASPRRRELLDQAGFSYRVHSTNIPETYPDTLPPDEVASFIAGQKMTASLPNARDGEIILTADSVVIQNGIIYGKPVDKEDAIRILHKLQGRTHDVITAICMARGSTIWGAAERTRVTMSEMTPDEISWYIDAYQPYDKAGAYGVQEWIGLCNIIHLEGTYANVMGLPVHLVYKAFREKIL